MIKIQFWKTIAVAAVAGMLSLGTTAVHADIEGDEIFGNLHSGTGLENLFDGDSAVVGDGVEFWGSLPTYTDPIDVHADFMGGPEPMLWIEFDVPDSWGGPYVTTPFVTFWFKDIEWVGIEGRILDVVLKEGEGSSDLEDAFDRATGLFFDDTEIHIRLTNGYLFNEDVLSLSPGSHFIHFDIIPFHVPEPATYLLLGSTLMVAMAARRLKRKRVEAKTTKAKT